MNWKQISQSVGKVAAGIAPLLSGPAGIAVSVGGLIAEALGVDNSPEAVQKALMNNVDASLKLQEMQLKHAEFLEQARIQIMMLETESEKARLADIQQAREVHKGHFMPTVLTILLFIAMMAVIGGLFYFEVPLEMREVLMLLIGSISTAFTGAFNYWLGSSRGSAEKQAILAKK
ncbi:hypothetical protein ACFGYG_04865 [Pasteurella multocida]|nr:hypothetical protein [Pasteurella multocida]HDR1874082.1 hypothetical protein [Pasteurella multocida]HDR1894442.1 hypothetical protein [Pasteurella multocida]HED4406661.1 hypothetical protein [Pasteurella multocida]